MARKSKQVKKMERRVMIEKTLKKTGEIIFKIALGYLIVGYAVLLTKAIVML